MKLFVYKLLFVLLCPLAVYCQEYGYTHYTSKEGLAGSTVYSMTQDKDGFLWFGTESGLSRFDGTHFTNFTRQNGLPDNEIIQVFADSKGRVWLVPFKKSVCYYYKGKIYTQANDTLLTRIHVNDFIIGFAEDKAGNVLMHETNKMHLVKANGEVTVIDKINGQPIEIIGIGTGANGKLVVCDGSRVYDYENGRFILRRTIRFFAGHYSYFAVSGETMIWRRDSLINEIYMCDNNRSFSFPFDFNNINYCIIDNDRTGIGTRDGAYVYDKNKPETSPLHLLPGLSVNYMMKDTEGNIWFTTLGHGVYQLSSSSMLNIRIRKNNTSAEVFAFARFRKSILAGSEVTAIYQLNRKTGEMEKQKMSLVHLGINPVGYLSNYKDKLVIYGASNYLSQLRADNRKSPVVNHIAIKGFFLQGDQLFVATKDNVIIIDPETLRIKDTIWHERSTAVYVSHDTVYIGTLDGLYCRFSDGRSQFLGDKVPELRTRITNIQQDAAGVLWVGTYGDGLLGYRDGRLVADIKERNGLAGNVCRAIYLNGDHLWVGTDKGLNKINVTQRNHPVTKYTTGDGLIADVINAIYVDSNKVFVGTPEGITFFDEEKVTSQSRCDLRFTDITVGGTTFYPDQAPTMVPHKKNSISFNFVGISYKSTGDIRYRYRLLGLDSTWHETRETFLSYPTLPSGEYELQLQAINKFDVHSNLLRAPFTIDKLLYERTWFRILIVLSFLAFTGLLVWIIIRRIRRREQEKTAFIKRIADLEQLSRKAQMNPHFIFNSLNSIQQYVMDADVAGANKFISGFSRLIRQTLDFSSKREISLEEELDYLTNYLDLEKTRLENAFSWSVVTDAAVDPAEYYIPPMILQPFVENSVRHGLRFRRDKNGVVTITVKREGDHLICMLEDNGIGRKAAMQYKSISPINYQSKGLSLTADRIAMFNQEHNKKIDMMIEDLEDNFHNSLGTRVTISFPVL
jgi:ligand-binding sensor domain-containing protein